MVTGGNERQRYDGFFMYQLNFARDLADTQLVIYGI